MYSIRINRFNSINLRNIEEEMEENYFPTPSVNIHRQQEADAMQSLEASQANRVAQKSPSAAALGFSIQDLPHTLKYLRGQPPKSNEQVCKTSEH